MSVLHPHWTNPEYTELLKDSNSDVLHQTTDTWTSQLSHNNNPQYLGDRICLHIQVEKEEAESTLSPPKIKISFF